MNKESKLKSIRMLRKTKRYDGYYALEDFFDEDFDLGHLSPFTKSSFNYDSDIVFILQDWAAENYIKGGLSKDVLTMGYDPNVRTNINLVKLLDKHFKRSLDDIFTTNLFPYIKKGAMNAPIPNKFLSQAALDFTIPMLKILKPKMAVCFGLNTFNALRKACGEKRVRDIEEAIQSYFHYQDIIIFCQAHTGMLGRNNRNKGGQNKVDMDWVFMVNVLNQRK